MVTILTCTICRKDFPSSTDLESHMESKHAAHPVGCNCDTCELMEHSETEAIECDFCDRKFSTLDQHKDHMEDYHVTDFLKCDNCMIRCKNWNQLDDHIRVFHGGERIKNSSPTSLPVSEQPPASSSSSSPSSSSNSSEDSSNL